MILVARRPHLGEVRLAIQYLGLFDGLRGFERMGFTVVTRYVDQEGIRIQGSVILGSPEPVRSDLNWI